MITVYLLQFAVCLLFPVGWFFGGLGLFYWGSGNKKEATRFFLLWIMQATGLVIMANIL